MEDIFQWQYFISWQKLQVNEVSVVMASGVCHQLMSRWADWAVLSTWTSFGFDSSLILKKNKLLCQSHSVRDCRYQKEMVFSHGNIFFRVSFCNSPEICLLPSELVYIEIEHWNSERGCKTYENVTKEGSNPKRITLKWNNKKINESVLWTEHMSWWLKPNLKLEFRHILFSAAVFSSISFTGNRDLSICTTLEII